MNAREAFLKIETDEGAIAFAKMVSHREVESPLSKAQWIELIQFQADANIRDPKFSKQQRFSKYIDTEIGKEIYWASKAAKGTEVESADKAVSTPMSVISDSSRDAYLAAARALEGGRAGPKRCARISLPE